MYLKIISQELKKQALQKAVEHRNEFLSFTDYCKHSTDLIPDKTSPEWRMVLEVICQAHSKLYEAAQDSSAKNRLNIPGTRPASPQFLGIVAEIKLELQQTKNKHIAMQKLEEACNTLRTKLNALDINAKVTPAIFDDLWYLVVNYIQLIQSSPKNPVFTRVANDIKKYIDLTKDEVLIRKIGKIYYTITIDTLVQQQFKIKELLQNFYNPVLDEILATPELQDKPIRVMLKLD